MKGITVGLNLPRVHADPEAAKKNLTRIAADGFDGVEIPLDDFPLIINGEISREYVSVVKRILAEHTFVYSAHIGRGINLRDVARYDLQRKVLLSSIEVCAMLGIGLLVLHYEASSKDLAVEERFFEGHVEAAEFAARAGVALRMENIEVDRVDTVIEFVKKIDRKDFLMNFDTGHAYLAARYFHFDYLDSLRQALPYLGHVHLSDNVGTFEELRITNRPVYDELPMGYRTTFGRGDIHIPPFWGTIPFAEVFRLLRGYEGTFLCEYNSGLFLPFNREVQEKVRAGVREARSRQ